jgi:hypothetical protein
MQKTKSEALNEFLAFVGEEEDDTARAIADKLLTRAVEAIWLKQPWLDFQSPVPAVFDLVANQSSYPLPDYYGRPGRGKVRNQTRGQELFPLDHASADALYPTHGTTLEVGGTPRHYLLGGIVGVQRQPAVAGEALEVLSSSAADITNVRVSLVGADANGYERRLQFTLTGATPVAVGTWSWIDEFGKGYAAGTTPTTDGTTSAGTITLRIVSTVTTLQTLFPEESAKEHRIVTFLPKPNAADVVSFPVMRRPPRLLFDADPLPADWWNAVLEEMVIQWRVNRGELPTDSVMPRPHLLDLIQADNVNAPPIVRRPFA